jgi:TatD DNase family protein
MLLDTHAHIQFQSYKDDRAEVLDRCHKKNMIVNVVGTQKDTSRLAVEIAEQNEWLYATIGTHPIHLHSTHVDEEETSFQSREEDFDEAFYEQLVQSRKVIGIGECGLDLYHVPANIPVEEVLEKQKQVFLKHVYFAHKHNLPLVIHCREAHDQLIEVLRALPFSVRGTVHCFTSGWNHAKAYLDMGLYLGFTGVLTFPAKKLNPEVQNNLVEVAEKMPFEKIVLETDSPYLAPQKYRGTRAEPWMLQEQIVFLAKLRGMSIEQVEQGVFENSLRLFDRIIHP